MVCFGFNRKKYRQRLRPKSIEFSLVFFQNRRCLKLFPTQSGRNQFDPMNNHSSPLFWCFFFFFFFNFTKFPLLKNSSNNYLDLFVFASFSFKIKQKKTGISITMMVMDEEIFEKKNQSPFKITRYKWEFSFTLVSPE